MGDRPQDSDAIDPVALAIDVATIKAEMAALKAALHEFRSELYDFRGDLRQHQTSYTDRVWKTVRDQIAAIAPPPTSDQKGPWYLHPAVVCVATVCFSAIVIAALLTGRNASDLVPGV